MSNMSKIGKGPKNKLHFLWCVVVIVCVVTTHYYQKYKSTENYHKMLEVASKRCDLETIKLLVKESRYTSSLNKEKHYIIPQRKDA
ncbi:MAG: ankyrin [Wolbachia endosymbiont of Fragariocoptes setiger]|nr:ankyrin [Wolbachia endosymbiont of Fragariocoptes setiger]